MIENKKIIRMSSQIEPSELSNRDFATWGIGYIECSLIV